MALRRWLGYADVMEDTFWKAGDDGGNNTGDKRVERPTRRRTPSDEEATRIVRAEMERRGVSYKQLAALLEQQSRHSLGFRVSERNLISRITRGTFTFGFAIEVLRAMGASSVGISPVDSPMDGSPRSALEKKR
jgi:uncharacterized protein DUF6471